MKKQKYFKREIFERFLNEEELEKLEIDYIQARLVNIGKTKIDRSIKKSLRSQ